MTVTACFTPGSPQARTACLLGLAVTGADLLLVWRFPDYTYGQARAVLALSALVALLFLAGGHAPSLGLTPRPLQGWRHWALLAFVLGAVVGVALGASAGVWLLLGRSLPIYRCPPDQAADAFLRMCILAPVVEETLYRLVLCVAMAPALGPRAAILVSGAAFALLHHLYGNPSPENQVGGFLLAWAYLRSGSVLVPVALHAGGNLVALAGQVAGDYWLGGAGG